MDIFDEMLNKSPKEKFIEIIQNANPSVLERIFENFFAEYIAMVELLEKEGFSEKNVKNFILENPEFIEQRQDDL